MQLLLTTTNFSNKKIKIYWGPKQDTYAEYKIPDQEAWHKIPLLRIPQVVRFFAFGGSIDLDKYKNTTPVPTPDLSHCVMVDSRPIGSIPGVGIYYYVYWAKYGKDGSGLNSFTSPNGAKFSIALACKLPGLSCDACSPNCQGSGRTTKPCGANDPCEGCGGE